MRFYITDVFGIKKYTGNQLATVIVNSNITKEHMRNITREFHFSETSFIINPKKGTDTFDIRIFTPNSEIPFAGHPTLGTAYLAWKYFNKEKVNQIYLNMQAGIIPVKIDKDIVWMEQHQPQFGKIYPQKDIADILEIDEDKIIKNLPVQAVSTGLEFIIVPLRDLKAVKEVSLNLQKYNSYFLNNVGKPIYVFSLEAYSKKNQINSRVFVPNLGIPEDPATGSATGCLGAYLNKYESSNIEISIEQGYEIGRESLLYLNSEYYNSEFTIKVGGKVIEIAEGTLY